MYLPQRKSLLSLCFDEEILLLSSYDIPVYDGEHPENLIQPLDKFNVKMRTLGINVGIFYHDINENRRYDNHEPIWKDNIDGIPITRLKEQFGSPLFVVSERKLRNNMRRIKRVFNAHYPDVVFGWSYKTNYLGAVCNVLHQEGSWAEVVSEFEYQKAR